VVIQGGEQTGVQIQGGKSRTVEQGEGQVTLAADTVEVTLL
jgi:hypothetical protein